MFLALGDGLACCVGNLNSLPSSSTFKGRNLAVLLIIWKEYHILLPAEAVPVFADLLRGLTLSNSTEKKAR